MSFLLDKGNGKVILVTKGEKLAIGFLDRYLRFRNAKANGRLFPKTE
jgi:hypothetical protein